MEEIALENWTEFEKIATCEVSDWIKKGKLSYHNQPLYRGHGDKDWKLDTTLDRFLNTEKECKDYDNDMRTAARAIETVTGRKLEFPDEVEELLPLAPTKNSGAMTWLRQNGFPSPLLDWSQSPFVAAYFAFSGVDPKYTDRVAIFRYVETESGIRTGGGGKPTISCLGPWIPSDKKHFLQQSRYTTCILSKGGENYYASHELGFDTSDDEQNHLVKYTIPSAEKENTLRLLKVMNITEFSLFNTTKGLLSDIALDLFING